MANRTGRGWFQPGHKYVGPGRGAATRARFVSVTRSSVSEEEWKAIVAKAKRDALGVRLAVTPTGEQRIEDDPDSDGATRAKARQFLAEYLMGKPPQFVSLVDEASTESILGKYSDAELDSIITATQLVVGTVADAGDGSGAGTGAAEGGESPGTVPPGAECPGVER
jgi:hypothetical protein